MSTPLMISQFTCHFCIGSVEVRSHFGCRLSIKLRTCTMSLAQNALDLTFTPAKHLSKTTSMGSEACLRNHFSRLPSTTLCALLSLVELWRLRSSCAAMLNVLPIVDILKQFISQRGVFVPQSFLDVEDLQVLCQLAQTAPGATWTLKSETDVRETIQTFKLAMQTWHVDTDIKPGKRAGVKCEGLPSRWILRIERCSVQVSTNSCQACLTIAPL